MEFVLCDIVWLILMCVLLFDVFDVDIDVLLCSDIDVMNGLVVMNKLLNCSDEDVVVEFWVIDVVFCVVLYCVLWMMNEVVMKGVMLDLCVDFIECEDEVMRAAGVGRRRAISSSEIECEEDVLWGILMKVVVEWFVEELEVVFKEKENVVIGFEKILVSKREATFVFE